MEGVERLSVVILDDDPLLLETLKDLVARTPGFATPRVFTDPVKALRSMSRRPPSVALVDLRLPGDSGLRFIRNVRGRRVETPILVLTGSEDTEQIVGALAAGADGYLLKSPNLAELVNSLKRAAAGETVLSASVLRRLLAEYRQWAVAVHRPPPLSDRECTLLELTSQGLSCQAIERQMKLEVHAVYAMNKSLYKRLGVTSRAGAAARWRELQRSGSGAPSAAAGEAP